jgi:hypothetical protein
MLVSIILLYFILLLLYYPEGTNRVSWYQKRDELSVTPASLMPSGQGISEINPGGCPAAPSQTAGDFYC